jgi:hypothetical protein
VEDSIRNSRPRAPTAKDWIGATPRHPCTRSVAQHYGTFGAALEAAGQLTGDTRPRGTAAGPSLPPVD